MIVEDAQPIFSVVPGGYYVGVWCLFGHEQDVMAMVYRNPDDTGLKLTYRFRYYKDEEVDFDKTSDEKTAYNASFTDQTEDQAIQIVDDMMQQLIKNGYCGTKLPWLVKKRSHRRIVRGDHKAMAEAVMKMPNMHQRARGERH